MKFKEHKQYRLPEQDYTEPGNYFITICTHNREEHFGGIENGKIILSSIGKIANELWYKLPQIYSNIILDGFIVMPDHIHGIIVIKYNCEIGRNTPGRNTLGRNTPRRVPTNNEINNPGKKLHPLIKNSISSIINHYKGSVKKWCNKNGYKFKWQSRFYDRVIRDDKELFLTQKYIIQNPVNWLKNEN